MNAPRLAGRRALITGAVEGIGGAIADLFAAEGASLVLTGRRAEAGSRRAAAIRDIGGEAAFLAGDMSDETDVRDLLTFCQRHLGGLDIVVNCAGIETGGPLVDMGLDSWNELLACNITTMFLVTKHAVPLLKESDHASIVNLGSTFGLVGAEGSAAYAVTKAAAVSLSKSMALELAGDGIRVNALCPGATQTEMLNGWADSTDEPDITVRSLIARHPLCRLSTAGEQATAALFLASDDASFVTGHALLVDGGYTAQ